jgi:hypothetical protein
MTIPTGLSRDVVASVSSIKEPQPAVTEETSAFSIQQDSKLHITKPSLISTLQSSRFHKYAFLAASVHYCGACHCSTTLFSTRCTCNARVDSFNGFGSPVGRGQRFQWHGARLALSSCEGIPQGPQCLCMFSRTVTSTVYPNGLNGRLTLTLQDPSVPDKCNVWVETVAGGNCRTKVNCKQSDNAYEDLPGWNVCYLGGRQYFSRPEIGDCKFNYPTRSHREA